MKIRTKASYPLALRRKAWEIVLTHLKLNGIGHGAYLSLVQNSITAAQEQGIEISDYRGSALQVGLITKDDLFGFLGGTRNPTRGPRRRISDAKFAVLDAYLTLIREPMWAEFEDRNEPLLASLNDFWKPELPPSKEFYEDIKNTIFITSSKCLLKKINKENTSHLLRQEKIEAIRLAPTRHSKIISVTVLKYPLTPSYIRGSGEAYMKVSLWTDDAEVSAQGTCIFTGFGAMFSNNRDISIATTLRELVTRNPTSLPLSLAVPSRGSNDRNAYFSGSRLRLQGEPLEPHLLSRTRVRLSSPSHTLFSGHFLKKVATSFVSLEEDAYT